MRSDVVRFVTGLVVALSAEGCKHEAADFPRAPDSPITSFQPVDPISVDDYWKGEDSFDFDADGDGKVTTTEIFAKFPNEAVQVSVRDMDAAAKGSGYGAAVSTVGGHYEVTVDYVKYRTDETDDNATDPVTRKVGALIIQSGVGIRMRATITTLEANINLTNLFGIAAESELKNLVGTLRFETIGIGGKGISPLIPLPSKISEESVQAAMQAAAAIKASLYVEDEVKIVPQVFARKVVPSQDLLPPPRPSAVEARKPDAPKAEVVAPVAPAASATGPS